MHRVEWQWPGGKPIAVIFNAGDPAIIDVTVHAHIFGHPRGAHYFEEIVAQAMASADVWVATRLEIAEFMLQQNA